MTVEIIPAVLPTQRSNLDQAVGLFSGFSSCLHIDVADGIFVPHLTWNIPEELPKNYFRNMPFEIHLMVSDPETEIEKWLVHHPMRIIFHRESVARPGKVATRIEQSGCEPVIAYNINSKLDEKFPVIKSCHLMAITNPGQQNMKLEEIIFERTSRYRTDNPDSVISVDGGVKKEHLARLISSGANRIVVGSAIISADNPREELKSFQALCV